jgi:muramoyltetrapeptide carboxypeptidase
MTVIKPRALKKGDTIGIISPSSPPSVPEKIAKGAEYLERLGYRVKLGKNVNKVHGYLAGTDEERAVDIHDMFADKSIKAIIAVRGGYGTPRLLPLINYSLIKKNPKILVGYSDLTALQLAIYKKTGLITFSGPMAGVEMWKEMNPFTEEHFWSMVTSKKKLGAIKNPKGAALSIVSGGSASGRLLGGNLSLITSILGSPFIPSFKNSILFFEEIAEECYRLDRMLNQLRLANILKEIKGTVIGELTDIKPSDDSKPYFTAEEVVQQYFSSLQKPVVSGLAYGHISQKVTMPIGIRVTVDAKGKKISFDEAAVS